LAWTHREPVQHTPKKSKANFGSSFAGLRGRKGERGGAFSLFSSRGGLQGILRGRGPRAVCGPVSVLRKRGEGRFFSWVLASVLSVKQQNTILPAQSLVVANCITQGILAGILDPSSLADFPPRGTFLKLHLPPFLPTVWFFFPPVRA